MPGPVSDPYDPEFGTGAECDAIKGALGEVRERVSTLLILFGDETMHIQELVRVDLSQPIRATLTEKEWRLIRFALERAKDSI